MVRFSLQNVNSRNKDFLNGKYLVCFGTFQEVEVHITLAQLVKKRE